ncbi:MAG: hypothetical protein IV103_18050 [Zoogloea sp.]|nr:hypothetical protein [Zoogloea sp.]
MSVQESSLRANISAMESEEILDRMARGVFSEEARGIALVILAQRGIDPATASRSTEERPRLPLARRIVPALFAVMAAGVGQVDMPFSGSASAIAATLLFITGVLGFLGWKAGAFIDAQIEGACQSKAARAMITVLMCGAWFVMCALLRQVIA